MRSSGDNYTYKYDPFYRLISVHNNEEAGEDIAEYRYNGLGYLIAEKIDTDEDFDLDNEEWYHHVYDERWRMIARYRETDSGPKEEYVYHEYGYGEATQRNDTIILRDRDADQGYYGESDEELEERIYYCHNWHEDVVVLVDKDSYLIEFVQYSSYGVPFGILPGDMNANGTCTSAEKNGLVTNFSGVNYDVRADVNLDGSVTSADVSAAVADTLGFQAASRVGSRKLDAGYWDAGLANNLYHV